MAVGTRLRHVLESQQFSRSLLEELFARADEMRADPYRAAGRLQGRIMAALFYEPSTRTRLSFAAAPTAVCQLPEFGIAESAAGPG